MQKQNNKQEKKLIENTFFLYIVTFSNQLINLVTVPYQTRILGATIFGKIGVVLSVMAYVQIFMDFGFILSATAQVAKAEGNVKEISRIMSIVTIVKLCLSIVAFGSMLLVMFFIPKFKTDIYLYLFYFIAYLLNSLLPDFIYRGLENMRWISLRTLGIRLFFMITMFVFVKSEKDYLLIPIFLASGNLLAVLFSYIDLCSKEIRFIRVYKQEILVELHETIPFFLSRFAASFYQALNGVIIGIFFPDVPIVGCYFAADKLISFSKSCASPIADSIYPYMIKYKNYNLIKKVLKIAMPCILLGAVVLYLIAGQFSVTLFGEEYGEAADFIRIMLPIMVIILPTYLLSFPVMVPLGIRKYANLSNIFGAIIQVFLLIVMFTNDIMSIKMLAMISCITEVSVFVFRFLVVLVTSIKNNKNNIDIIQ